jgi:3-hydroxy-3-methylglutaryl CoA synthase
MIDIICGFIYGSGATLLIYSLMVGKRIQEEQEKATKCIFKYEGYRRRIRTLEYQKHELEKKLESIEREEKNGETCKNEIQNCWR